MPLSFAFDAILQGITDGVTVQHPDGHLLYANEVAARIIGYPSASVLLAAPLAELIARVEMFDETGNPLTPDRLPGRLALRGEAVPETLVRYRVVATGIERWSVVNATPIRDGQGQIQGIVNVFRDVTESKRSRDRLRFLAEAGAELGRSLDYEVTLAAVARLAVPDFADWCAVDICEEDGSVRRLAVAHVDPAKVELAHELHRRYPTDSDAPSGLPNVLRTGTAELYGEITDDVLVSLARDEQHLEIARSLGLRAAMIVPLAARGRTLGAVSFVSAESGRRYGPDDLAFAEQFAARAALAVDNARLYRQASAAVAARDEFISVAAHELRTPTTSLVGFAQLLGRQLDRGAIDPERLRRATDAIAREATRLSHLVGHLLDVSQLEAGKLTLERQDIDVVQLVRDIVEAASLRNDGRFIEVCAPTALRACLDPARLEQVLINLLNNAVKFSPDGRPIDVVVAHEGDDWAALTVRDRGIGIPLEHRDRIFEPFYQAHANEFRSGMGLGLHICREIVRVHGGTMVADFPPDGGTRVIVRLPVAPTGRAGRRRGRR